MLWGCCVREACCAKLVGGVDFNWWGCTGVHETILAREIYCVNPNPKNSSQYGSRVCKVPGTQYPQIIWDYDLATSIVIRPLTQTLTRKMDSSIFAAMSRLKVVSMTWASLPIIPSTYRSNGENVSIPHGSASHACPSSFFPTQEKVYPYHLNIYNLGISLFPNKNTFYFEK